MSEVPPGSVVITPDKLYQEVTATRHDVSEMRAELREVMKVIPDHETRLRALEQREDSADAVNDVVNDVQDHESRLRSVERSIWLAAGFAAGGGGLVGSVLTKLLLGG